MNKFLTLFLLLFFSCNTGKLNIIADLPMTLKEVSGLAIDKKDNIFWMVNDSGNKPILYGLNNQGSIVKTITIKAKNRDWEDLTIDDKGNIYIGDFGNNENNSKHLSVLKISKDSLNLKSISPEIISFEYPKQKKFPPKNKKRHFDCEAFFFYKDSLYLFTKSRSSKSRGRTDMYQLPSIKGHYNAKYISTFNTCEEHGCWVTSADINKKGDKLVLLTENSVFLFTKLNETDFLKSDVKRLPFNHRSQKESVSFKNDNTVYITDENVGIHGGNLYEFKLN